MYTKELTQRDGDKKNGERYLSDVPKIFSTVEGEKSPTLNYFRQYDLRHFTSSSNSLLSIMGKSSITNEQKEWLESHIPAFVEAQKKSTVSRFHSHIAEGWFEKYPERNVLFPTAAGELPTVLTPPQESVLRDAITGRKRVCEI